MDYLQTPRLRGSLPGLAAVALLHGVVIYAFVQGMNTNLIHPAPQLRDVTVLPPAPPPPPTPPQDLQFQQQAPSIPNVAVKAPDIVTNAEPRPASAPSAAAPPTLERGPQGALPSVAPPATVLTAPHFVRGAPAPDYPDAFADNPHRAVVQVACTIEPNGAPTGCRILASGGSAFDREALRWLNGPDHPIYRPGTRDGVAVPETHAWSILFQP
jgi:protein TonB